MFKLFFKDLPEHELHDAKEGMRHREARSVGVEGRNLEGWATAQERQKDGCVSEQRKLWMDFSKETARGPPHVSEDIWENRDTEDCLVRCAAKETKMKGNY